MGTPSQSSIQISRDANGRFVSKASPVKVIAEPLVFAPPLFKDDLTTLRVHVLPSVVSQNVSYDKDDPVFMIRNETDPRNAIQCRAVRFTGEVRGVFDRKNRLRGSQTAAWMETNAPVYVTDEYGYEFLLDSQQVWKNYRNFDYDTNVKYTCGQAPSDGFPSVAEKPKINPPVKQYGC